MVLVIFNKKIKVIKNIVYILLRKLWFKYQIKPLFSHFNNTVDRNVSWYAHIYNLIDNNTLAITNKYHKWVLCVQKKKLS